MKVGGALAFLLLVACNPSSRASASAEPSAAPPAPVASASASAAASIDARAPAPRLLVVAASPDEGALSLIRTERLRARAEGRVLVVYVSATWCEPCKKMKKEIEAGRLDARLGKTTLLAFDADKDVDRLGAAGYSFRFVPFVALPGADGHPADTQQATGKGEAAWRELLGKLDAWQRDAAPSP